ncbi:GTP-binding protein [Serratia sp. UGAL515B_01]|uniref:CobW family GTP-binding protein n=1 Tax=Serratia sp. UGAL515B_01 TaxID=2986763 RepID=UPI0029531E8D|nr:GTP-binding protein [Serratia sp. UGAL515B_01]WON75598.1 GTP-binding protein [Serratia sp. UGAL515B_01]
MNDAVPVTILSGFLGSGKTTLINYLLEHNNNQPIAILENEFGAVSIDGDLLRGGENVSIVELSNGCVCCSVRGEFTEALHEMLDKRAQGTLSFDRLIVETTGLADPAPIVQTFFVDERLRDAMHLDAVITLADCEHIQRQLSEHRVAAAQIGFADRILLTKTDRVDESLKAQTIQRIHQINSKAEIFEIVQGKCPPSLWLDIHAFELNDNIDISMGTYAIRPAEPQPMKFQAFRPVPKTAEQSWSDDIQAHIFEARELDLKKIGVFMESIIELHGNDMLRYKGVLAIAGNSQRLIVQGIHKVVGFDYGSEWEVNSHRRSRLVVIGRYLPIASLREGFMATEF